MNQLKYNYCELNLSNFSDCHWNNFYNHQNCQFFIWKILLIQMNFIESMFFFQPFISFCFIFYSKQHFWMSGLFSILSFNCSIIFWIIFVFIFDLSERWNWWNERLCCFVCEFHLSMHQLRSLHLWMTLIVAFCSISRLFIFISKHFDFFSIHHCLFFQILFHWFNKNISIKQYIHWRLRFLSILCLWRLIYFSLLLIVSSFSFLFKWSISLLLLNLFNYTNLQQTNFFSISIF